MELKLKLIHNNISLRLDSIKIRKYIYIYIYIYIHDVSGGIVNSLGVVVWTIPSK